MTSATLLDVAGAVPDDVTDSVLTACRSGSFASVQVAIADTIAAGWAVSPHQAAVHAYTTRALAEQAIASV